MVWGEGALLDAAAAAAAGAGADAEAAAVSLAVVLACISVRDVLFLFSLVPFRVLGCCGVSCLCF